MHFTKRERDREEKKEASGKIVGPVIKDHQHTGLEPETAAERYRERENHKLQEKDTQS